MTAPLVAIRDLTVQLPKGSDRDRAIDGINLDIPSGRILCIVGESGSGKSMTAHAIMGLVPQPLRTTGSVRFGGQNLVGLAPPQLVALFVSRRVGEEAHHSPCLTMVRGSSEVPRCRISK